MNGLKSILIFGCTAGTTCLAAASSGTVNWWAVMGAALLASIAAVLATGNGSVENLGERNLSPFVAGMTSAAGVFVAYQLIALSIVYGVSQGLILYNKALDQESTSAVYIGILSSVPILIMPIGLIFGAVVLFRTRFLLRGSIFVGLSLIVFSLIGQIFGLIFNQTAHFEMTAAQGWLSVVSEYLRLVLLLTSYVIVGAVLQQVIEKFSR